ncbi:hypothetical protein SLEP1_g47018 [Rubroshorea leprosula]|uniref:Ubiquitin-like protease family profile domain-containing protein n=1 Tax=Rubroshorea leprosula TaxID=152421 RepID=A0AAV5LPW1_9ROSI|nr:hypothetical protein SLEP1_g47018 [Rubroshorea leprosula]
MASIAEIHGILQNICTQDEAVDVLIWANPVSSAHLCHETGSPLPLKTVLCVEGVPWSHSIIFDRKKLFKWQYKEGEGIVGNALKYNRPFYVPLTELKENVCPYIGQDCKKVFSFGALAIKLSSAYANCGDYESSFGLKGHLVELPEHDTAISDTMLVRSNPPSQSTSDFNLNLINQTVGNAMDGQLPMQQLLYTGVLDAMPTQGNLQAQPADDFGSKGKTFVVNPGDGNVLQWPPEQGPPIKPHVSVTSNIKASGENIVAPPIGDFNLNGRISSCGNNQIAQYHVTDIQVPHKQPKFEFKSEKDLESHILHVYNEEKHKLCRYFDELSCRFNLTINLWKDDAKGMVNCCLTTHFIDDSWELKMVVLTFKRFENDFGAISWSKVNEMLLSDWNINKEACSLTIHNSFSNDEIVHHEENSPSSIFYLSYDKCISDINYMAADISLKSIYQVYKEVNHLQNKVYTLMSVECGNNQRICSLILAVVTILHPNLKLKFVQFVYEEIYGVVVAKQHLNEIFDFLTSVYDEYAYDRSSKREVATAIGDTSCSAHLNANDRVLDSFQKYLATKPNRLEFYQYLEDEESYLMEIGILKWWQNNSSKFPTMVKMARDFLAIPLSTIVSNSAFTTEVKKIVSSNSDQDLKIINAIICCQDWLASVKTLDNEKSDEKLRKELRVRSEKDVREYLVWDFTKEDLQQLRNWKNHKSKGQLKVKESILTPFVIPLLDAIIQATPQLYYIGDEAMNTYFDLLKRRSEENPNMFLKHDYVDSSTVSFLLDGCKPIVPSWITPEKQINTCKLFLPSCLSNHWTLFYVDIKDHKFVWLNPLRDTTKVPSVLIKQIRSWFENTLLPAMGLNSAMNWPLHVPMDIPQQQNAIDCGIFVMKYADCLTHANCIGFPFSQKDMPHFRRRIFLDLHNQRIHVPESLQSKADGMIF